ncbi:MAG: phosphocholine cytidylyltransferase family protein [Deltaproteobacteria bacterium]|nr:phosphocholine cytidylyltransferase family protein [Deltaproteobacteria bacterium]
MQAVILAAGTGSRLEKVSGGAPKCLIEIDGRPLIEHQLEALHDAGVGKVLVVVGHKAMEVKRVLGHRVEYVDNPIYDITNSLYSLWLARDWIKGPFVLLNCDLLFDPSILHYLIGKGPNALVFDSTSSMGKEQTKVVIKEGRVVDIGKDVSPIMARGESLGMLYFDAAATHALFSRIGALVNDGGKKSWVMEGIRSVCTEIELKAYNIAGMPWVEIDFPNDYERAKREVWPAIRKGRWKKTVRWQWSKYAVAFAVIVLLFSIGLFFGSYSDKKEITWTNGVPSTGKEMDLKLVDGYQKWWKSSAGHPVDVTIKGPTTLRIETRLLMPVAVSGDGRYVVEVKVDGKLHSWESLKATPDKDASIPGDSKTVVGDRDRVLMDLPQGKHSVRVDLAASTSNDFLVRIRYPEPDTADDNEQ